MELRYRVLPSLPGPEPGPGVDASVDLGPGATVGDLAEALTTVLGRVADHTPPLRQPTIRTIGANGVTLAPGLAAATCAPRSGSSVTVVEADDSPTPPPLRAPATLEPLRRLRPGPPIVLCYGSNPVGPGDDGVGCARSTDVAASIEVGREIRVVSAGSTHRVELDGIPVLGSATARTGTLLRIGGHLWAVRVLGDLRPPDSPPVIVHDGQRLVWPSPGDIDDRNEPVVVPAPPSDRRPPGFPLLSTAVPLLLGLVAWWITGSWTLAGFMAASVIYVIASALEARREARRDRRANATAFEERLRAAAGELSDRAEAWRDRSRRACPDGEDLIRLDPPPAWTRAGPRLDLTVRVGTRVDQAPVPVRLADDTGTAADAHVERAVRDALEGALDVTVDLDAEGTVALTGPDEVVDGLARSIVVQLAGLVPPDDLEVTAILGPERRHAWRWIDWLPHARGGGSGDRTARRLVIIDGRDDSTRQDATGRSGARPRDVRLWLSPGPLGVPADVGAVVTVEPGDRPGLVTATLRRPRRPPVDFTPPSLDHDDAEAIARHWAGFAPSTAIDRLGPGPTLTDVVTTSGSFDDAGACAERWRRSDGSLAVPIGTSDGGVLVVDLRRDGPHTLVAGTTGSGKSELLRTVLVSAALHHPPTAVQFLLVDYKGGTAFGDLVDLPHTVGLVTDLDEALGLRVVVSLRAELRRRERAQRAGRPVPALLVVVDEFATLSRELPSFVDEVVDVAQRGRSLGLHLVLATQRPAGVVTDAIRANTSLRIALRVADPDDSRDVVGSSAAAELDRSLPGTAVVRIGTGDPRRFRVAHSGGRPAGERGPVSVRPLHDGDEGTGHDPGPSENDALGATQLRAAVAAAVTAADDLGLPAARRPWCPPLSDHVALVLPHPDGEPRPVTGSTPAPIGIGLVDRPDLQRVEELVIDLWRDGGLVVTGASGSGRSTTLAAAAAAAAAIGTAVHAVDTSRSLLGLLGPGVDVVDGDDPDRTLRMLRRLAEPTPGRGPVLLLVDDWHALRDRHERVNRGEALGIVSALATTGRRDGLRLAVSSLRPSDLPLELTAANPHHLRLRPTSPDEAFHGAVPSGSAGPGTPPGRGVLDGHLVQVAVPPPPHHWPAGTTTPTPALPRSVPPGDLPAADGWRVPVGVRTADLDPAHVDLSDSHLLVVGPRRSGRTTVLEHLTLALGAAAPGRPFLRVSGRRADAPLRAADLHAHLGLLLDRDRRDPPPRTLVVIDDLDDLLESGLGPDAADDADDGGPPIPSTTAFDDRLCAALRRPDLCCVVAVVDADGVGRSYAESPRLLRSNRRALLVDPDADVHAALVHAVLPPHDELPRGPGSLWLVDGGRCVPVRGVDPS